MKLGYRLALCVLLLGCAALCASYTVRGLRVSPAAPVGKVASVSAAAPAESGFTLCAKNGCVAVLDPACDTAVVTDIELSTLREADRRLVEEGLAVGSREELLALLEDLGS